jgi:hypothetical protein
MTGFFYGLWAGVVLADVIVWICLREIRRGGRK